jgi:hypothetical protein
MVLSPEYILFKKELSPDNILFEIIPYMFTILIGIEPGYLLRKASCHLQQSGEHILQLELLWPIIMSKSNGIINEHNYEVFFYYCKQIEVFL